VRVHRHRRLQLVAEWTTSVFADAPLREQRAPAPSPARAVSFEVGGPGAVGPGGELGLALDRHVHHLVAAGGDDVPLDRLGVIQYSRAGPLTVRRRARRCPRCRRARPRRPPPQPRVGGRHLRRHLDALGQPVDVDPPFVATDLVPGERAEERAAAQRQEAAPVHPVPGHPSPTSLTTIVMRICVGWIVQMNL